MIYFLPLKAAKMNLKEFLEDLNNKHETIKFSWEYSQTKLNFLDITVNKDADGYLTTSLYRKPYGRPYLLRLPVLSPPAHQEKYPIQPGTKNM